MHERTIKDRCPYCGKRVSALVSIELSKPPTSTQYNVGKDMLRENAEEHKDAMYPPNTSKARR